MFGESDRQTDRQTEGKQAKYHGTRQEKGGGGGEGGGGDIKGITLTGMMNADEGHR